MANTGYKQAYIAYKVGATTGDPLDVDGNRTAESGKRQAILLLVGYPNPDAARYEVQGTFERGQVVAGEPTRAWDPADCPTGEIFVTPSRVVVQPSGAPFEVVLFSSGPWTLAAGNTLASFSMTSGPAGFNYITVTPSATQGQRDYIFTDTATRRTASLRIIIAADVNLWILANGTWNNLGFWFDNETWNY